MNAEDIALLISRHLDGDQGNFIPESMALRSDLAGLRIFEDPLLGISRADDPLYEQLSDPAIVGPGATVPTDWLDSAKSVISIFLPYTARIKEANASDSPVPVDEWMHGRIEGQQMMNSVTETLSAYLRDAGFEAMTPALDERFKLLTPFSSNWSERHVAHISGLGTFGLSRGLITEKGMAGRLGSIITSASLEATERDYDSPFEYCTLCGRCQQVCPVDAIDAARGIAHAKDQEVCSALVDSTYTTRGPGSITRYGCGKCQTGVPCESGIPH